MPQLDDLHTRLQAIESLIPKPTVPSSLEPLLEIRAPRFLEAENAGASLVEVLDERDVEVCHIGAETEVYVCECGAVRAVDRDRAAGQRPLRAVCDVGCFVDVGAWLGLDGVLVECAKRVGRDEAKWGVCRYH